MAAVLAVGFDIRSSDGKPLQVPDKDEMRIPLSVMKPVIDPDVVISRRNGWHDITWDVHV